MKLEVPFYRQTTLLNCGPTALKMVLAYCGKDFPLDFLEREVGIKEGKGVMTIQMATAAAKLGFKTRFFTKSLGFDPKNLELDFYKKYVDVSSDVKKFVVEAHVTGVVMKECSISLEDIELALERGDGVLALVDWNVILHKEDKGYQGHFVPIVGFEEDNVLVHNCGLKDGQAYVAVNREVFERARKARGTDEDLVFISKK